MTMSSNIGSWFGTEFLDLACNSDIVNFTIQLSMQKSVSISYAGMYNTVGSMFTESDSSNSTTITYIWTLISGQTILTSLCPITFGAQFTSSGTIKSTGNDTYSITTTTSNGQTDILTGSI